MKTIIIILITIMFTTNVLASEEFTDRVEGDLGLFVNSTTSPVNSLGTTTSVLPYAYADYGRIFGRIDTFGIKTVSLGFGHLEVVGQVRLDGYKGTDGVELSGIKERKNSLPIGLGTFQLTPFGGLFLYSLYDTRYSHGNINQLFYVVKIPLSNFTLYPQLGVEHLSSGYTRYYYGVSPSESTLSNYASYDPSATTNTLLSLLVEIPIKSGWYTNVYLRRKWLGAAITDSPLVSTSFENNGFIAIAYRFQ